MKPLKKSDNSQPIEQIIEITGGLGRWQIFLIALSMWTCVVAATNHMGILFLGAAPDFHCTDNPHGHDDKCSDSFGKTCHNFTYDTDEIQSSLVTKWNLVCTRVFLIPIMQGTYFGGVIFGNIIGGPLSDIWGRRKSLIFVSLVHIICAHSLALITNYYLYLAIRFLVGGSAHAVFAIATIIVLEVVPIQRRTVAMCAFQIGWNIGYAVLTILGYLLRSEFNLQIAIASLNLIFLAYILFVPESPRWLLVTGHTSEARDTFVKIAKWNGVFVDDTKFDLIWKDVQDAHENVTKESLSSHIKATINQIKIIINSPLARNRFLLCIYPWFVSGLSYYGIFLSVKLVMVNKYVLVMITCIAEIVFLPFINIVINKVGRVKTLIFAFITCGVLGMTMVFVQSDKSWLVPILVVSGKAISAIFWFGCGLHSPELFPTSTRNAAFCFLDASSKIGAAFAPFIVDLLALIDIRLPNVAIGLFTVLAAIPYFFLPETMNADVPETIDDMENMNDVIGIKCCRK